ncbi:cobalamin biosynthesis protein [Methanobrevibacter sp. DSM 116169]|uniref:cobalamin biosynthesis protein n=1 Tax=Methanobrevibacter sp. DSM 116169 TaxID=3242727 RepID=UPI0038FD3D61
MIEFNINNLFFTFTIIVFILSLIIDLLFGELPTKIHPVVLIGKIISILSNQLIKIKNKVSGMLLLILTIAISLFILLFILYIILKINIILFIILYTCILSSCFSFKLLLSSAHDIKKDLENNIDKARSSIAHLVSRDTEKLDETLIISATIESLSENIVDSYLAPVFYYFISIIILNLIDIDITYKLFILISIPIIYRVINTLDAMVGYKNKKYSTIGYFSAKCDDLINFIPARLGGLFIVITSYILKFDYKNSFKTLLNDSSKCPSPNSGYTMASTAGALNIQLVKEDVYVLGDDNKSISLDDIDNSIRISKLTMYLFTLVMLVLTIIIMVV